MFSESSVSLGESSTCIVDGFLYQKSTIYSVINVEPVKMYLARNRLVSSLLLSPKNAECSNKNPYCSNGHGGKRTRRKNIRTQKSLVPRLCLRCFRGFSFGLPLWYLQSLRLLPNILRIEFVVVRHRSERSI